MPTMTIDFLEFPTGSPVPGLPSISVPFMAGPGMGSAVAPQNVPGSGPSQPGWGFGFWNVNGTLYTTETVPLPQPDNDYSASAWYFGEGGTPQPDVFTWAFSLNQNKMLAGETPIGSVSVAGAWSGPPATTVLTNKSSGPVTIEAVNLIGGAGGLVSWLQVGGATATGKALTAPYNSDVNAIAFYAFPNPDPCADLRAELQDLSPGDFQTPQQYEKAYQYLHRQLVGCEQQYGELPTVRTP